jgi:cell wall-associated NlpC family hydrolase
MLTKEQREAVVVETKGWLRTPYVGWACVKGLHGGTDCGQIIYGVFRNTGHLPYDLLLPRDYSLQIAQHQASTEYVKLVEKYFREIPEAEVQPADLVLFKLGLALAHGGIIVAWPDYVIHAIASHGVTGAHGKKEPRFRHCEKHFYTLKDEYC